MKMKRKGLTGRRIIALSLALLLFILPAFADDSGEAEPQEAAAQASDPDPAVDPTPDSETAEEPDSGSDAEDTEGGEPAGPAERVEQIIAIFCAGPVEARMSFRPALEDVLPTLPGTADATLYDGAETWEEEIALAWSCADYDAEKTEYIFTAAQKESGYPLAEGVGMPVFTLTIADEVFEDYTYRLDAENMLTITGWNGLDEELAVPEMLNDIPVAHIAAEAFRGKADLVRLALPKGVKSIGEKAFADCPLLESLSLPDSLEVDVPADALDNDDALKELILSADLDSRLAAADTVERDIPGEDEDEVLTLQVKLPGEITDIQINAGSFTLACDYAVAREHGIGIAEEAALHVGPEKTLTLSGTVQNDGALTNAGTIIDCGGAVSGNPPRNEGAGRVSADHIWQEGRCLICGAAKPEPTASPTPEKSSDPVAAETPKPTAAPGTSKQPEIRSLKVQYSGSTVTKVYDRTTGTGGIANMPQKKDFSLSGVESGHDVYIDRLTLEAFDSSDAGDRRVSVKVTLAGADKDLYKVDEFTIPGVITPRALIIKAPAITPGRSNPLTKTFGATDPRALPGVVKKGCILPGDEGLLTGALAREPGEEAGRYKMLSGTVSAGKNYKVQMEEYYFTIAPKNINGSDVGLVSLKPQPYTGKPVKPDVTLRVGSTDLVMGKDFTVSYSGNIDVGSARVLLKGIGNYAGQRETTFRILNTSGGNSGGGTGSGLSGGGSGSSLGNGGFSGGNGGAETADEDKACRLLLDGRDYGEILFDGYAVAQPFEAKVDEVQEDEAQTDKGLGEKALTEKAQTEKALGDKAKPEKTQADKAQIDEDEGRKLALTITAKPMADPETDEELPFVEDSERRDYGELHLRVSPGLAAELRENDYTEIIYQLEDARLCLPLDALVEEIVFEPEDDDAADADKEPNDEPSKEPDVLRVKSYDVWIEQVQMMLLSEEEDLALEGREPLAPVYRLWIQAVPAAEEDDASELVEGDGMEFGSGEETLTALPVWPENVKLYVLLPDDLGDSPEPVQTLSVPVRSDPDADNGFEELPAVFVEMDEKPYADMDPIADGMYAVVF